MTKKFVRINPLSHQVYEGRLDFFSKLGSLSVYDNNLRHVYKHVLQKPLPCKRNISVGRGNFFNLYANPLTPQEQNSNHIIVGDIFTNSLCRTLRGKNMIYYTEFFLKTGDSWYKKAIFFIASLFFRRRKVLVPTYHAYKTRRKYCHNVLYFPQLYSFPTHQNPALADITAKILYVGKIDDRKKNVKELIEVFLEIHKTHPQAQLTLIGRKNTPSVLDEYAEALQQGVFTYIEHVPFEQISSIYLLHNIFVLPSVVDPIGAVVMEAMAHSLPVVVSANVGASSYVEHEKNGRITDSRASLKKALITLIESQAMRKSFGEASRNIVEEHYLLATPAVQKKRSRIVTHFITQ